MAASVAWRASCGRASRRSILLPGPRWLVLMLTSAAVIVGLMDVLVVVLVVDVLRLPEAAVGFFAAILGAGAVLGGVLALGLAGARRLTGAVVCALVASGLAGCLLALAPRDRRRACCCWCWRGWAIRLPLPPRARCCNAAPMRLVLGRVFGLLESLYLAALALGSVLGPLFIDAFGPSGAWAAAGLLLVGLALVTGPGIRSVDRENDPDAERLRLARGVPFLAALPSLALERVAATLRPIGLNAGGVAIAEGDVGDSFFIIREGRFVVSQEGHVLRHLGSGDAFGEIALLRNVPRTATVTALDTARLYRLERDEFQLCVTAFPTSRRIAHASVDRALAASAAQASDAAAGSSEGRTHDEQGPASQG